MILKGSTGVNKKKLSADASVAVQPTFIRIKNS